MMAMGHEPQKHAPPSWRYARVIGMPADTHLQ